MGLEPGDATLGLTTTGEHTLDAWLRVDLVLLVTDTNYVPSGLGPAENSLQTITETIPGGLGTTSIAYQYDALYRLTDAAYTGAITATGVYPKSCTVITCVKCDPQEPDSRRWTAATSAAEAPSPP